MQNNSRLLYSKANTTRAQLAQLVTPPALGAFHNPVPFAEYVDSVDKSLNRHGLHIVREEYEVTHGGNRLFGALEVAPLEGELITAEEWRLLVGVRGSHDQRFPRGLAIGTQVKVCSNLCFGGNLFSVNTKQTTFVQDRLPQLIDAAVSRIPQFAALENQRRDTYRLTEIKPRWGDAALVEIYRRDGLSASQLGRAVDQWHAPVHDEHAEGGYTAWRLFNACTEALKPTGGEVNHHTIAARSQVCNSFIAEIANFKEAA